MRLKRALHARQPWIPKPASGADAAARVAVAWAWRLGPSGAAGSAVAVLGEGGIQRSRHRPAMGRPRFRCCPGTLRCSKLGSSPCRQAALPRHRAAHHRRIPVPVTGAPRSHRRDVPGPGQENAKTLAWDADRVIFWYRR